MPFRSRRSDGISLEAPTSSVRDSGRCPGVVAFSGITLTHSMFPCSPRMHVKHMAVSILCLFATHCKVSTTERFRIRATKNPKTTEKELKKANWNPCVPDSEHTGWMHSDNHSRQALDTGSCSLALSEEGPEGRKH